MSEQFLIVKARNTVTGQTVKQQDLTGARFTLKQRAFAQELAERLAVNMTARTGEPWTALVEAYTPTVRKTR
jgi:hypothetical protein